MCSYISYLIRNSDAPIFPAINLTDMQGSLLGMNWISPKILGYIIRMIKLPYLSYHCNIPMIRICEIDIGNLKTRKSRNWFRYETLFTFLSFEFFDMRRETQSFYADCFYIVSSQPNQRAAPVAQKVVWPRSALKVNLLLPTAGTQLTAFSQISAHASGA